MKAVNNMNIMPLVEVAVVNDTIVVYGLRQDMPRHAEIRIPIAIFTSCQVRSNG